VDFSWSPDQIELKKRMAEFARSELNEGVQEADHDGRFSREKWQRCADFGVLGLAMPKQIGGAAHDTLTVAIALEGLGYGCLDNGLLFALNAQMWTVQLSILRFGCDAQKERYLPDLVRGAQIGAHAITEPESGSDAYALKTRAEKREGGYVLNGEKTLITLAPVADLAIVFATVDPDKGAWGVSAFIVETDNPGVRVGQTLDKMGLRTVPMGELHFSDCFVPEDALLGPEGAGMAISNSSLEWERACMLTTHIGSMERQLEKAIARARNRKQFGQPIGKFQSVSNRIVDMKLGLECARLLAYQVAWKKSQGGTAPLEAALAKICLSEGFVESSLSTLLVHGGEGYLTRSETERDLRDSIGSLIWGGTSDLQRNWVARLMGL
jgi:alkylation response protein AidB-like acyl-CoA dehydrogenase